MKKRFAHYENVEGWLEINALLFTSFYTEKFLTNKIFDSLEIGVHHGKFFFGLENITPLNCRAIAIDVFNDQDLNILGSGKGDIKIFQEHSNNYSLDPSRVQAIEMDSLDIDPIELGRRRFGLISIDGGRTKNHTISDLSNCGELIKSDGLLILSDILSQDWCGVATGAINYFSFDVGRRISPFAIGFNKLFCCHFSKKDIIFKKMMSLQDSLREVGINILKTTEYAGHEILVLHEYKKAN